MKKPKIASLVLNMFLVFSMLSTVSASGGVKVPQEVVDTLTKITKILLLIGSAVCIGKIIHIGILYVTASAVEKSHAKEAVLPWIIGTVVCFGAATIGGGIIRIFTEAPGLPSTVLEY